MTTEHWPEIERLFAEAIEQPDEEREAFVRKSASGPHVAEEVVNLVRAHRKTGLFDPVTDSQDAAAAYVLQPGSRLGAWEVVGELGRGGMGVVYLVRRADGHFERAAALKILPVDTRGPQAEARFLAERQILARLSHPRHCPAARRRRESGRPPLVCHGARRRRAVGRLLRPAP